LHGNCRAGIQLESSSSIVTQHYPPSRELWNEHITKHAKLRESQNHRLPQKYAEEASVKEQLPGKENRGLKEKPVAAGKVKRRKETSGERYNL
jgi:hypothetical protein